MNMAEYTTELKNFLTKINKLTWTEVKMLENKNLAELEKKEAGPEEQETIDKARQVLIAVTELLEKI